jgi:hypothetical protein
MKLACLEQKRKGIQSIPLIFYGGSRRTFGPPHHEMDFETSNSS